MSKTTLYFCIAALSTVVNGAVHRASGPITVDGALDEAIWKEARKLELGGFKGNKVSNRTTVQLAYDSENLYVAFVCYEKQMDKIVANWSHVEERDNSIWTDDCVELLVDPSGMRQRPYHVIVNTSGVVYDAYGFDTFWDASLSVEITKHSDRWVVEMAIPFADFGMTPKGGEVWLGNLCREQKPRKEYSSLFPAPNGFKDPESFGQIVFEPAGGDVVFMLKQITNGRVAADIRNNSSVNQKLTISVNTESEGKKTLIGHSKLSINSKSQKTISLPFKAFEKTQVVDVKVTQAATGKLVYSNRFVLQGNAAQNKRSRRVWQVDKPLYRELMSDKPIGLSKQGTLFWAHGLNYGRLRPFAMQYGLRYVYDEFYQLMAQHKLKPLTNGFTLTVPSFKMVENAKKHGVKVVLVANRSTGSDFKIGRYPFLLDPAVTDAFVKSTDKYLKEHKDVIWAVMIGDEVQEHDEKRGVKLFETKRDEYEFIRKADQEVKEQYGGGVYGMPTSLKDKNPYRWIAYRRWLNDRYYDAFTRFYKRVKEISPKTLVVSFDPIAFHHPFDFSRASECSDILTHQLYPRRSANRATFGFITKLLVDISGMDEVWPCAHIEEYAASFTPEEVVELISQVFRNGGSGLKYFLADTVGRRTKKKHLQNEYYGAPDRWQVETALLSEIRKMNRLKFPEPDCAILYSCDSRASQPPGTPSDEVEFAYTMLGPVAGSWFKFVDDNQIDRGTVQLSDYKVIYVPYATYQRRSVVEKLIEYVRNGGTLVCADPLAFSNDVHGKDLGDLRKTLLGASIVKGIRGGKIVVNRKELPVFSKAYEVKVASSAKVLARFQNGSPAIMSRGLAKGRVYYFAANPFVKKAVGIDGYREFFKRFQKQLGLETGHAIWRFQFPMDLIKTRPAPSGRCLTGNYIHWQSFNPLSVGNIELKGTYSYSLAPDSIGDQGGVKEVSFGSGDLTDRRKAPTAGNVELKKSKLQHWVVRYKKPDPFSITFDLGNVYPVKNTKLFYSHGGTRPGITVEGSSDGATWKTMGSVPQRSESAGDVRDVDIRLSGEPVRYLRVSFAKRDDGNSLTLSELEIWAK